MQPGRQILSLDEIRTKEDIGKSAVLGAEGSVVVQVRVPLTEKKKSLRHSHRPYFLLLFSFWRADMEKLGPLACNL